MPPLIDRFPEIFNVELLAVFTPKGAKNPPDTVRFPQIVAVIAVEFVKKSPDDALGVAPVDSMVKLPFIVVSPPKLNVEV